jgi:hypothetical protein
VNAITGRFIVEILQTTLRWSEWAERVVAGWPAATLDAAMAAQAQTLLRENADAVAALASLPVHAERAPEAASQ